MKLAWLVVAAASALVPPRVHPVVHTAPMHPGRGHAELAHIWGHYDLLVPGTVSALLYAPDGKQLLAVQDDRSVRAWDLSNALQLGHWPASSLCLVPGAGFAGGAPCDPHPCQGSAPLALMPGGHTLLTATEAGTSLCELSAGRAEGTEIDLPSARRNVAPGAVASTPDGKTILVGGEDGAVAVYTLSAPQSPRSLNVGSGALVAVASTADGKSVVSASVDGVVQVTQLATGKKVSSLNVLGKGKAARRGKAGGASCEAERLESAAFSPDGTLALVATRAGLSDAACSAGEAHVKLWELRKGQVLWDISGSPVRAAAFSPDGREVALATAVHPEDKDEPRPMTVVRVAVKTGRPVDAEASKSQPVTALQFSRDGARAASGDAGGTLHVWDAHSGAEEAAVALKGGSVTALAFNPSGQSVLVQTEDDATRLFSVPDGRELRVVVPPPPPGPAARCPQKALEASQRKPAGAQRSALQRPPLPVKDPAEFVQATVLPQEAVWLDSRQVLSPKAEESCVTWGSGCELGCERSYSLVRVAAPSGKVLQHFPEIDEELLARCNRRPDLILTKGDHGGVHGYSQDGRLAVTFAGQYGAVKSCDATPDGSRLLVATATTLSLWDGRNFRLIQSARRSGKGGDVALSPDGSTAVDISGTEVRLLRFPSGEVLERLPLGLYDDVPSAVAFSPEGESFAVGTARGVVLQFALRPRSARR